MIQWCAYCQTYIGEVAPLDVFAFTHGMCNQCAGTNAIDDPEKIAVGKQLGHYYETMQRALQSRDKAAFKAIYSIVKDLGISPLDFAIGMMQPLLYETGQLWAQGKVTVADQHFYSAASADALSLIHGSLPHLQHLRQNPKPEFLLIPAQDNSHYFGLLLIELYLILHNTPCWLVLKPLADGALLEFIGKLRPKYLGVSVAMPAQIAYLRHLSALLENPLQNHTLTLLAGGFAFRSGAENQDLPQVKTIGRISGLAEFL